MAANSTVAARYLKLASSTPAVLNLTMMVRAYATSALAGSFRGIVGQINNSTSAPTIYLDVNDSVGFDIGSISSVPVTTGLVQPVKQWFHVALTVFSSDASTHLTTGYVDGREAGVQASTDPLVVNSLGFCIPSENYPLTGYLRDVRIWNRALSGTEVALEYASSRPVHRQGLILAATLDKNLTNENTTATGSRLTSVGGATAFVGVGGYQMVRRRGKRVRRLF